MPINTLVPCNFQLAKNLLRIEKHERISKPMNSYIAEADVAINFQNRKIQR